MLRTVFICTLLLVLVNCKQAVPFNPIHPGSIHADHFSPLSGTGVLVDIWEAETFTSNLLDFGSLTSFTPVTFDIAGGISFNNQNFQNLNAGPISINSETNNLNIEALRGAVEFNSFDTTTISNYGTDINFQSFQDSISLLARNDIQFTAPSISLAGNNEGGVHLTSPRLNFISGSGEKGVGHFDFTGEDIYFRGDSGITIDASFALIMNALDILSLNTDGNMDFIADGPIILGSKSGSTEFEGSQVNTRSNDFFSIVNGANSFTSVLGEIQLLADSISVSTVQQVRFEAVDSIVANAVDDIVFSGADSIQLFGDVEYFTSAYLESSDLIVESQKDSVTFYSHDFLSLNGNSFKTSATDSYFTGQQLFQVNSNTITLDSTHKSIYNAGNLISMDGVNGKLLVEATDDLFIHSDDYVSFNGPIVNFLATQNIFLEFGADLTLSAANNLNFQFQNFGVLRGENRLAMSSQSTLLMTSTSLVMTSDDNTFINAREGIIVTTNGAGGDVSVDAPYLNFFDAKNSLTYTSTSGYSVTSSGVIDILSEVSTVFSSTQGNILFSSAHNTDISGSSLDQSANGFFELSVDDELQITTQDLLAFQSNTFTSFTADTYFRLESGDFEATGEDIDFNSNDLHIFTRKSGLIRSEFGPINVDVSGYIDFISSGELIAKATDQITFSGSSITWEATDYYQGDVSFISKEGDLSISGSGVSMHGDRFETYSAGSLAMTADSQYFNIEQRTDSDANDYGNIIFTSNDTTTHTAGPLLINARDWEVSGDGLVHFDSLTTSFTTTDNTASSFLGSTYGDVLFTSNQATFASETTNLNSEYSTTITSGSTNFQTGDFSNIVENSSQFNGKSITTTVSGDYTAIVDDFTDITGSSVAFETNGFFIQSSGEGGDYHAGSLTRFLTKSGFIGATAGEDITFTAVQSTIDFNSRTGDVTSNGGAHTSVSQLSTTFTADTLAAATFNNGFVSIDSDFSIVQKVTEKFTFEGIQTPLEALGRSGLIQTTAEDGHICIVTNSPNEGPPVAESDVPLAIPRDVLIPRANPGTGSFTSFSGESVLFSASGPNAELIMDSQGFISARASNSINIHAYGSIPSDPQFILEDQTFGVLFRTSGSDSPISFNSAADYTVFSFNDLLLFSEDGTLSSTNGNELDFRTYQENADIIVRTREGDILTTVDGDAFYTSGTPSLPADTLVNATRNIALSTDAGNIYWNQFGTSSDPNKLGIQLISYSVIDLFADGDLIVDAQDGGIIDIETRQGNMNFQSLTNDITQTATTGAIHWDARGSATFTSNDFQFSADGQGGSIYLHSGADQKFTIHATETKLFFEAENGEISVTGTDGINADITADFLIDALTSTVEGGSVYFTSQTDIDFFSTYPSQIGLTATVEFTVDAEDAITFSALDQIVLHASGNANQAGLSMTTTSGNIAYLNTGKTDLEAINIALTSVSTTNINTVDNIDITSTRDSFEQDNILIFSQTASISFTSVGSLRDATLSQTTTSAETSLTGVDVILSGSRELRTTVLDGFDHTLTDLFTIEGGNIRIDTAEDLTVLTTEEISILADSYLNFSSGSSSFFDALSLTHNAFGQNSLINLDTVAYGATMSGDITVSAGNLINIDSASFSLDTTVAMIDAGSSFHQKSIGDYTLNTADFSESSGKSQILNIGGKFTLNTATTNIETTSFELSSLQEASIKTTTTNLSGGPDQPINFIADNTLTFESVDWTVGSTNDILIQNNDIENNIEFNHNTITDNTPIMTIAAQDEVRFDADTITLNIDNLSLLGSGIEGVELYTDAAISITSPLIEATATDGNVSIFTPGTIGLTTLGPLSFNSLSNFGDIQLISEGGISITTQIANFKQIPGPSTRGADGYISFVSSGPLTLTPATSLTFDSDDNVRIQASTVGINGVVTSVHSSSLALFETGKTLNINAGTFLAKTSDVQSLAADESKIQVKTNVAAFTSGTTLGYTASDEFETISEVFLLTASTDFTIDAVSPLHFAAELGGINLSFGSASFTAVSDVHFNAVGNDGRIDFNTPTGTIEFDTVSFVYEAGGSIWTPFNTLTSPSISFNSAKDISIRGDGAISITASTGDLSVSSHIDGRIQVFSAGTTSITGSSVSIRADGMLGNTNGRYVLEDSYWQSSGWAQSQNFARQDVRINRNTMGIEFNAVNGNMIANTATGDINLLANYGSIEFRAQRVIRYLAPNTGGFLRFFGIPASPGTLPAATSGSLQTWTRAFSTNYCADTSPNFNFQCTNLSTVLNEMILALMRYGLLQCSNPATDPTGWCDIAF